VLSYWLSQFGLGKSDIGDHVVETIVKTDTSTKNTKLDLVRDLADQMDIIRRTSRCTKRTAARIAIMNVIRSGIAKPGELLPSEIELTKTLGVSLGTVQIALRGLQDIGTIVRRRGDGTRVAAIEPLSKSIWHFRFVSREDGTPLRFTDQKVSIDRISTHGVWSDYLGTCAQYVRISRLISMQNDVRVGAEMFLDAGAAKGLVNIDVSELTHLNVRPYLEETFGLVTTGSSHLVKTTSLSEEIIRNFNLASKGEFYEIHAKAFSGTQHPIYFQRIYVAINDCALSF